MFTLFRKSCTLFRQDVFTLAYSCVHAFNLVVALVVFWGPPKKSYLGPPESLITNNEVNVLISMMALVQVPICADSSSFFPDYKATSGKLSIKPPERKYESFLSGARRCPSTFFFIVFIQSPVQVFCHFTEIMCHPRYFSI